MMPLARVPYVFEYESEMFVQSAKRPDSASHERPPTSEPGVSHFQLRASWFGAR